MIKKFTKLCRMSQADLKKYVAKQLEATHDKVINGDGYVFAQGKFPVLLVAHLDTVHEKLPETIYYDKEKDAVYSPEGIGGDDRCGVYMIFEVLKQFNCSVLFCEDEEIGTIGASKFIETKLANDLTFNYIIEFDRKGRNDAVFYDCDNPEFEDFITKEFFETQYGSFSDISTIAPYLGCAAVNLSCGYYGAHTKQEYVVMSEMQESIVQACKILERTTDADIFDYIESDYSKKYGDYYSTYKYGFDSDYDDLYVFTWIDSDSKVEQWEEIYAYSDEEAVGTFCMKYPTIPYCDVDMYHVG